MFFTLLCALLFVQIDTTPPIDTEVLSAQRREQLPYGYHPSALADMFFLSTVDMQYGGSTMGFDDRPYLSAHGRSAFQTRWFFNGMDLTDPAFPGTPLIELPSTFFDTLTARSLWTSSPGFEWRIEPRVSRTSLDVRLNGGTYVGGPSWMLKNVFDRDPATHYGASAERRHVHDAERVSVLWKNPSWGYVMAESIRHQRIYPTLKNVDQNIVPDTSQRHTLLSGGHGHVMHRPIEWVWMLQHRSRTHEGAQYRFPQNLTFQRSNTAAYTAVSLDTPPLSVWKPRIGASLGYALTQPHMPTTVWTQDLTQEWMWMHRPQKPFQHQRLVGQLSLECETHSTTHQAKIGLYASHADVWRSAEVEPWYVGITDVAANNDTSVAVRAFEGSKASHAVLQQTRLQASYAHVLDAHTFEWTAGADVSRTYVQDGLHWASLGWSLGSRWQWKHRFFNMFSMLRAEPDAVTMQTTQFLDPYLNNGRRYLWQDHNQNNLPNPGEAYQPLERFGGRFHALDPDLKRPWSAQFVWGMSSAQWGPFVASVSGIGRWHMHRHTVQYDKDTQRSFQKVSASSLRVLAPSDTRGDADKPSYVYARDLSQTGQESYVLTNDTRSDFWLGTELRLRTVHTERWFMDLGLAGYWNMGAAPFGSFADRNDPGVIDETSADPNAQINDYGRYDQDRSYVIKWQAGGYVWRTLQGSVALRYRDGQPFTRIGVMEDLPQGSTAVMLYRRGRLRHTFHMSLDTHVAYTWDCGKHMPGWAVQWGADVYNLLQSGVEILENPVGGAGYRDSLEMIPGRTVFMTLSLLFVGKS